MKNKFLLAAAGFALLTGFLNGCNTTRKTSVEVQALDSARIGSYNDGLIYGLPQTRLTFTIDAVRMEKIPGPYHKYGEELLGLSEISHESEVIWRIADIEVDESQTLDYQNLYSVSPKGRFILDWSKFSRNGWIIPFDGADKEETSSPSRFYPGSEHHKELHFTDLSVKRFVGKETRTVYEKVWRDSMYARVPVEKTQTIQKTPQEKAREAASFIFMIREKRFELISGMGDYYPDGTALQTALNEMNRLEEDYLDLFRGKTFRDTLRYTIQITPKKKHLDEPVILFRFSRDEGIIEADNNAGAPVWLDINRRKQKEGIMKPITGDRETEDSSLFYYRLPVESSMKLRYGDQVIAQKYLELAQFGPVLKMPLEFLQRSGIIHYPPKE
jgi:hypothetical protein